MRVCTNSWVQKKRRPLRIPNRGLRKPTYSIRQSLRPKRQLMLYVIAIDSVFEFAVRLGI